MEDLGAFLARHWLALSVLASAISFTAVAVWHVARGVDRINANVIGLRRSVVRNARRGARAQSHMARGIGRVAARTERLERGFAAIRASAPSIELAGCAPGCDGCAECVADSSELGAELEAVAAELAAAIEEDDAELAEIAGLER